ncbi:MAG: PAS domain-containing protein, partial [Deltaproteobacteria bacterium]|nr:PAS domain-containing protein [Deltaproteobacteria bacterium]
MILAPICYLARNKRSSKVSQPETESLPGTQTSLLEQNPCPVMRLDAQGTILYANPGSMALLAAWGVDVGYPAPAPWPEIISESLGLARPKDVETQVGPWSFQVFLVPTPDNNQINLYAVDITERKMTEFHLRKSEKKYRELFENLRDAALSTDMTGRITQCNNVLAEMLGYKQEELLDLTNQDITSEKWWAHENRIIRSQVIIHGYSQLYEKEFVRKDGQMIPVELRA